MSREIDYIDPNMLIIIGLDTEDGPEHPLYDERAFLEVDSHLVANILVYGILQTVRVRREGGRILVVDGRQRVKAARLAADRSSEAGEYAIRVPVWESEGDDKRIAGIMISSNEQRKADSALDRAFKAVRLLALLGDEDEVGIAFGRSKPTIKNYLSLASADSRIHTAVREGSLSTQAAIELSKLARDEQVAQLTQLMKAMTGGRITEAVAKAARREVQGTSASDPNKAAAAPGESQEKEQDIDTGAARVPSEKARQAVQAGIKRTWLRKALKTEVAKDLDPEHLAVLRWFAFGETKKGDWFEDFVWQAESEMEG
jgi:ParB family transcriptional regulator, chromosome partitioning protein